MESISSPKLSFQGLPEDIQGKISSYLPFSLVTRLSRKMTDLFMEYMYPNPEVYSKRHYQGTYTKFKQEIWKYFPTPQTRKETWRRLLETQLKGQEPWAFSTLQKHSHSLVTCLAVHPTSRPEWLKIAIALEDRSVRIFVGTSRLIYIPSHTNTISCMAFLANGNLVTGSEDRTLKISSNQEFLRYPYYLAHLTCEGHEDSVTCLSICYATNTVFSGSLDGTVRQWAVDGEHLQTFHLQGPVKNLSLLPENAFAYFSPNSLRWIRFNTLTQASDQVSGHKQPITCLSSLSEDEVLTGASDHCLCLWSDTRLTKLFPRHQSAIKFIVPLSHRRVFVITDKNRITLWNLKENKKIVEWQLNGGYPIVGAQAHGQEQLVTVTRRGTIHTWFPSLQRHVKQLTPGLDIWVWKRLS